MVGLSIGVLAMPRQTGLRGWIVGLSTFVVLANLPDLPVSHWGHDKYHISHSLFVNLAIIALVSVGWLLLRRPGSSSGKYLLLAGILAWLSHLILDSFYNHGHGIAVFWPFSDARLHLAIPWFRTLDLHHAWWSTRNMAVMGIELLAYSPLMLLAIAGRVLMDRRVDRTSRSEP